RRAFGSLNILFNLNLSSNSISEIKENAFEGLLQLLRLNMSHNRIEQLHPDSFNTLVSLRSLDLSHNQIIQLDNTTHSIFGHLLSIDELDLSNNRISLIKDQSFPYSPWIPYKLRKLDLSYNTLPILTSHFDNGLNKLEWLSLQGNIINEIHPNTLGNMTRLRYLDLSKNDLRRVLQGTFLPPMKELKELDLSQNKLKSLISQEIKQMQSLNKLNLRSNKLSQIDLNLIEMVKRNLTLVFKDNYLHCDCNLMPLVAWIFSVSYKARYEGKTLTSTFDDWLQLKCFEPASVQNKHLYSLRAPMIDCNESSRKFYQKRFLRPYSIGYRNIEKFRKRRQDSIRVVWFIQEHLIDIGSFQIILKQSSDNRIIVNETVGYSSRSYLFNGLQSNSHYTLC
ncbi:leucine-rich transmembrane protein 2, partial [Sarcoptes scabiei]